MKKESLGDNYKKALKRIKHLEGVKKKQETMVDDLCQLVVNQDRMLGERNVEIQKMKEGEKDV